MSRNAVSVGDHQLAETSSDKVLQNGRNSPAPKVKSWRGTGNVLVMGVACLHESSLSRKMCVLLPR